MDQLRGQRVTVVGLGRFGGGIAVSRWLVEQGASVLVTDQAKPEALQDSCQQLAGVPIQFRLGEHRDDDFTSADLVVASPAVPPDNRYLQMARQRGVPITTEIRLFIERCPAPILGVTGTKGKSTATAMLGDMLKRRYVTWVGGNMGKSLLFDLPQITTDHLVVLELSSFMLEYLGETRWSPHVALITMVAIDHIDRHHTFDNYLEAKKNLVRFQTENDYAVLYEDSDCRTQFASVCKGRVLLYGLKDRKRFALALPGEHNQLNAQAAFAAASVMNITWDDAQEAIRNFTGLPHRLQLVHEHQGVRYYNDSIATIPEAAIAALESFPPRTVIQIVGGYDKKIPLTSLHAALLQRAKMALCIGETGAAIAQAIEPSVGSGGGAEVYNCRDLPTAVRMARQRARSGDVVLLSPGCASYGQFRNFEERGDLFTKLVREP